MINTLAIVQALWLITSAIINVCLAEFISVPVTTFTAVTSYPIYTVPMDTAMTYAVINIMLASVSSITQITAARNAVDPVYACSLLTRSFRIFTIIHIYFAVFSYKSNGTVTHISKDSVKTNSAVLTNHVLTVVNIFFTVFAFKSCAVTITGVTVDSIFTTSTPARLFLTVIYVSITESSFETFFARACITCDAVIACSIDTSVVLTEINILITMLSFPTLVTITMEVSCRFITEPIGATFQFAWMYIAEWPTPPTKTVTHVANARAFSFLTNSMATTRS